MNKITLNKEEFKIFDQNDQFEFFYDEEGFPTENADDEFDSNVDNLYEKYDYIIVDFHDNIFGVKSGEKDIFIINSLEAHIVATEVKY